jgi:hypothetical protein
MGMEMFEIFFSQDRRLGSSCVSIKWLAWLLLCRPKGDKGREIQPTWKRRQRVSKYHRMLALTLYHQPTSKVN